MSNDQNFKTAEDEFARVCATTTTLLIRLKRFYEIASSCLPNGVQKQKVEDYTFLNNMAKSGELEFYLVDGVSSQDFLRIYQQRANEIYESTFQESQNIVDSAAIVFAHGIIEACVYGYLTVTSIARPDLWECYVKRKQVELKNVKSTSFEEIRKDKIDELLRSVERESLVDKLDRFHKIAPPEPGTQEKLGFYYDRDHLVRLDDIRQKVVHGNDWSSYKFIFAQDWHYWHGLNFYLAYLVHRKSGLNLSPEKCAEYMKESTIS